MAADKYTMYKMAAVRVRWYILRPSMPRGFSGSIIRTVRARGAPAPASSNWFAPYSTPIGTAFSNRSFTPLMTNRAPDTIRTCDLTHSKIGATTFEGRSSVEAAPLEPKTLDFFPIHRWRGSSRGDRQRQSPDFLYKRGRYPCQGARDRNHREALSHAIGLTTSAARPDRGNSGGVRGSNDHWLRMTVSRHKRPYETNDRLALIEPIYHFLAAVNNS